MAYVSRTATVWALALAAFIVGTPTAAQEIQGPAASPPPDRYVVGQARPPAVEGTNLM